MLLAPGRRLAPAFVERSQSSSLATALFAVVTLLALLFYHGRKLIFEGFIYALGLGVEKWRSPRMGLLIYGFGLPVLCACGIEIFSAEARGRDERIQKAVKSFIICTWRACFHLLSDIFTG